VMVKLDVEYLLLEKVIIERLGRTTNTQC